MQDLQIWTLFIDLLKEKHGQVIFLSLPLNTCECVRHLSIVDNSQAEGLKTSMNKLDEIYLQDPNASAYMGFKEFCSYKRDIDKKINDFLVCYEFTKIWYDTTQWSVGFFCVKCSELVWEEWKIIEDHICEVQLYNNERH